jgi:carbon storage regulator
MRVRGDAMLVLTRRIGETIQIGDDVRVTISRINGGSSVKLAIEAPKDVAVMRLQSDARAKALAPCGAA